MAAVLAAGAGAALSHDPAGHLLRLTRVWAPLPEVTIPTTAGRTRPGIVIHCSRLERDDVFVLDGIPITTVPRTLLDLAPRLPRPALTRACHEAWVHHRTTPDQIRRCIERHPHKPGATKLWRALGADVRLSDLEDAFVALVRAHRMPLPRTNIDHGGDKVDCHWPAFGLTIELLSFRYHATRQAFENDVARRRRSNHVAYTYGDIVDRPAATIADLRPRLGQPQPTMHAAPHRPSSC